ncbi:MULTISPECIES: anti-sigma factor family protein [Alphaproteobacteria]|uniref:Membrane protein n=2 Tax=Alphaproteobacteria TaxID=28211 RepID=A0A512HMU5_9HYPH|nr:MULTISPECIES: anti-sigma factor [Alphaproteobacteria]GEO86774.1 membrane protein [Ciceribacter naphthalenivorans]GLR23353.1 membrane protein [Ciceribacter naphthalenivorans]GLT06209.1 membrane protein [Sphingomonas psychrolutea]
MTDRNTPVSENDLHAYVDGFLDPDQRREVETWLDANPDAAAMVADWQRQNADIRDLFASLAEARADDDTLVSKAGARTERGSARNHPRLWQAAAAVTIFVGGTVAGQLAPPLFTGEPQPALQSVATLPDQSRSAFLIYASDIRHPVEVGADEQQHLAAWLGKRLDTPLRIPNLTTIGLKLVGGRLVPVSGKAGALLMYEDDAGERITVLLGRNEENRETSFRYASLGDLETFYWIDGPIGYAVTGEISRERLQQVADECYRQFET